MDELSSVIRGGTCAELSTTPLQQQRVLGSRLCSCGKISLQTGQESRGVLGGRGGAEEALWAVLYDVQKSQAKFLLKPGTELRYPNRLTRRVKTILSELVCLQLVNGTSTITDTLPKLRTRHCKCKHKIIQRSVYSKYSVLNTKYVVMYKHRRTKTKTSANTPM